jgi:hypothetical protein
MQCLDNPKQLFVCHRIVHHTIGRSSAYCACQPTESSSKNA